MPDKEETAFVDEDLLVNVMGKSSAGADQPGIFHISYYRTYANSPPRPNSLVYEDANASGVTEEPRSHSKVSDRFCVPTMMST